MQEKTKGRGYCELAAGRGVRTLEKPALTVGHAIIPTVAASPPAAGETCEVPIWQNGAWPEYGEAVLGQRPES
jgi:hypothetical protein